jgi:filamentous hemagglutinin family protein
MNHIYRSIWSEASGTWIAVSETTQSKGKCSGTRNALLATGLLLCSAGSWALPTGEQLVAGQASISIPAAGQMHIEQTSQQAIVNWQGFSIAPNEAVNIHQPNVQAAILNRVVGQDASQIQGQLNANGQVYLVNPNGVLFGKTAQVDVGGLIASTHNIKDTDFLTGIQHFTQDNATGTVSNQGTIKTPAGGVVALIGNRVSNEGTISTPKGTTALAAGKTVDLDFQGNGLVEVKVSEATLNTQINNNGAILADGGRVVLTAQAAGQLIDTVINQDGIIRAQGLTQRNGEIILDAGNAGVVQVNGTLNADGQQGGNISIMGKQIQINNGATVTASGDNGGGGVIVIGDKQNTSQTTVQETARISVQSKNQGNAGSITVFANMNNGTVNLAGQLDASAPKQGNGGFIDTSAAHVKIANSAKVSTKAATGKTGNWLIDPPDFTIAASGGDITGTALSASLNTTGVTIFSTAGATGVNGDVNVNDVVNWSANLLTLNAQRNININANLNGSGTAQLALQYGQADLGGEYLINNGAKVTLPAGASFSVQAGSVGAVINYTVITSLGAPGSVTTTDLQGMNGNLNQNYALGADIDASVTSTWNGGAGFNPVGSVATTFNRSFEGLGHTISNLFINRPAVDDVGLFGSIDSFSSISNIGLLGGSIVGANNVGALVGESASDGSTITNAYAISNVNGINQVGGLVGNNGSIISNAYAAGNVSGTNSVGGLVGDNNFGDIRDAYATGNVTGTNSVGGLVGNNGNFSFITNTYAAGSVTGVSQVGGLVGNNGFNSAISNSFWNTQTTAQAVGIGLDNSFTTASLTGKTTAEMQQLATFSSAGWSIANTQGSSSVWRIYEGFTAPLLRSFLVPLTVNANISETYNGLIHNALTNASFSIAGAQTSGHFFFSNNPFGNAINVGSYPLIGTLFSDQQGFDISSSGTLTITPAALTITANSASKIYGQLLNFAGTEFSSSGLQNDETIDTVSLTSEGAIATAPVAGNPYSIVAANPTGETFNASNYNISFINGSLTINRAPLTIAANNATKVFDGLAFTGGNGVNFLGFVNNETSSNLTGSLDYGGNSQGAVNPGSYFISPLGLSSGNYDITFVDGILSIDASQSVNSPDTSQQSSSQQNTNPQSINQQSINQQIVSLQSSIIYPNLYSIAYHPPIPANFDMKPRSVDMNPKPKGMKPFWWIQDDNKPYLPTLQVKNSAGRVKRLQLSADRQFLSLLLEDNSVRIWDFQRGVQRRILTDCKGQTLTDISAVDDRGEFLSISCKAGVDAHNIISSVIDDKLAINASDINHFVSTDDGSLLLVNIGTNKLLLWDYQQGKAQWLMDYKRGTVNNLSLTSNKRYAAILSRQPGAYSMATGKLNPANDSTSFADLATDKIVLKPLVKSNDQGVAVGHLQPLTDAVDILDLATGKIMQSLPNLGEQVVYMHFKDNDTLLVGLASGELLDWSITAGHKTALGGFKEEVEAIDNIREIYAYVARNGMVHVGNNQGDIELSIQNADNPIKLVKILENGKKLLTVLANGDLALWDMTSGNKMLRLFSTKQGWTVMDAFGRFDGSDEAMENFSWIVDDQEIPLDSFSENYYEPGLLTSVLQNLDYLNSNPDMVEAGISLPPKVDLQLAEQQTKGDEVLVKLSIYDRGGGIDKVNIYQNGRLISTEAHTIAEQSSQEPSAGHHTVTLSIIPGAGKNTLKVIASNNMGIENSSAEISFDGKTKAYASAIRLLTVGINNYREKHLHLDYSVPDAKLIEDIIKNDSKQTTSKSLLDEKATKPQILAELKEISQGSQQDVLVIYFAGHGVAVGKEWYFLPYETRLQPNVEKIVAAGISATELNEIFKQSKIQHILLMVDSCYSGAGMSAFSTLENGQRYFSRQLSRSLGITVIAAATKDQEATELKSLGHGLFTYLVAQELQKPEETQSFTAHGIAKSIADTLPAFSKKMTGSIQEPVVYTKGNDFMLTDLLKDKK